MIQTFVLVCAVMWLLVQLNDFGWHSGVCLQCGGKGDHRDDCPLKHDD